MKRGKLEIIRDILEIISDNNNSIRSTPLLRKANLSSKRYNEYFSELLTKELIKEKNNLNGEKFISLTQKGYKFLEKYKVIVNFIDEFNL